MSWSDFSSYLALGVSILALAIAYRFQERQKKFMATQELWIKTQLRQAASVDKAKKQAELGARIASVGRRDRLKVFNSGEAAARNVRLEVLEGEGILMASEIDEIFPVESIEPRQNVELDADAAIGVSRKLRIRLLWEDDFSMHQEKIVVTHG